MICYVINESNEELICIERKKIYEIIFFSYITYINTFKLVLSNHLYCQWFTTFTKIRIKSSNNIFKIHKNNFMFVEKVEKHWSCFKNYVLTVYVTHLSNFLRMCNNFRISVFLICLSVVSDQTNREVKKVDVTWKISLIYFCWLRLQKFNKRRRSSS